MSRSKNTRLGGKTASNIISLTLGLGGHVDGL
jgi:hypothetical protein